MIARPLVQTVHHWDNGLWVDVVSLKSETSTVGCEQKSPLVLVSNNDILVFRPIGVTSESVDDM